VASKPSHRNPQSARALPRALTVTTPMTVNRLLMIDDDQELCELARRRFSKEGYELTVASTGAEGLRTLREAKPSLIILDIGLPDTDGVTLCQHIRKLTDAPVVMLTADVSPTTAVEALELGASDYVRKPVDLGELVARVRAALRPAHPAGAGSEVLQVGPLRVQEVYGVATYAGEEIGLSASELKVLGFMARRPGTVLSKEHLLRALWEGERDPHLIQAHVSNIRRKLRQAGCESEVIRTVHTAGYVFVLPDSDEPTGQA
jgi:DNA-binding response OmpR family regulator